MKNVILFAAVILLWACNSATEKKETPEQTVNIVPLADSNAAAGSVYLTRDRSGNPVMAWTEEAVSSDDPHFYFTVWDKRQNAFGEKKEIPTVPNISLHDESMPKIAFGGKGIIYAVYELKIPGMQNRYASALQYIRSLDSGKTWSSPEWIGRDTSKNASRSYFDLCVLKDGTLAVCWLGNSTEKGRPLMFTKTDSSGRFLHKGKYDRVVDSFACQCCRTAIFANASGQIDIAYRDILLGNIRDISLCTSPDNGKSFGPALDFSKDNWKVEGCPHNGPDIVSDSENVYVSWFAGGSNAGAYYGELNRKTGELNKQLLSAGGQKTQLCFLKNGNRLVVYNEHIRDSSKIGSVIRGKIFPGGKLLPISQDKVKAFSPVIVPIGKGVIVAWLQNIGDKDQVVYRKIGPEGFTD